MRLLVQALPALIAVVLGVVFGLTLGATIYGCVPDVNQDGRTVVVCGGDSNTDPVAVNGVGWCEHLAMCRPGWHVVNVGLGGTWAAPQGYMGAPGFFLPALDVNRADAAVIAWGTNDVRGGRDAGTVVESILALRDATEARGVLAYVALVPPIPHGAESGVEPTVEAVNAGLRAEVAPDRLLDFWTDFDSELIWDGVHLTAEGQAHRGAVACAVL